VVAPRWRVPGVAVTALSVQIPIGGMGTLVVMLPLPRSAIVVVISPVTTLPAVVGSLRRMAAPVMRRAGGPGVRVRARLCSPGVVMVAVPLLVLLLVSLQSGDLVVQL